MNNGISYVILAISAILLYAIPILIISRLDILSFTEAAVCYSFIYAVAILPLIGDLEIFLDNMERRNKKHGNKSTKGTTPESR